MPPNATTDPSQNPAYDPRGAAIFIVVVVVVYAFSIILLLCTTLRKKDKWSHTMDTQATDYFRDIQTIQRKARIAEMRIQYHNITGNKNRSLSIEALATGALSLAGVSLPNRKSAPPDLTHEMTGETNLAVVSEEDDVFTITGTDVSPKFTQVSILSDPAVGESATSSPAKSSKGSPAKKSQGHEHVVSVGHGDFHQPIDLAGSDSPAKNSKGSPKNGSQAHEPHYETIDFADSDEIGVCSFDESQDAAYFTNENIEESAVTYF